MFWRSTAVGALTAACLGLAGCQTANRFADNTTTYNLQAEQSGDRGLLLNVIRASKRRPLVFADLQTITGTTPVAGSLAVGIPVSQNGGKSALTTTPTLTLSGGPSAAVSVVNTQDFYEGMLKPVPMSTIDLLVQRGISRDLLFNLLFSSVTFSKPATAEQPALSIELRNYPDDNAQVKTFQEIMELLIDEKVTTGQSTKAEPSVYGPPLLASDLAQRGAVSSAVSAGMTVEEEGWCDLDDDQHADLAIRVRPVLTDADRAKLEADCAIIAPDDEATKASQHQIEAAETEVRETLMHAGWPVNYYELQKAPGSGTPTFCYDTPRPATAEPDDKTSYCSPSDQKGAAQRTRRRGTHPLLLRTDALAFCNLLLDNVVDKKSLVCAEGWNKGLTISFSVRSTYSVIYYLGEVVRRAQDQDNNPRQLEVRVSNAPKPGWKTDCFNEPKGDEAGCTPIFAVNASDTRPSAFLAVRYDGKWYSLGPKPLTDKTYEAMDLVIELIALNRSAKDLPSSSVVTLVGTP